MSDQASLKSGLDLEGLRAAIREEYQAVALAPQQGFHFHTGRPLARMLEYRDEWLEGVPETSIESFAGTGNPFRIDEIRAGERVVDVGCGAGIDSLIAAGMVGPGGKVLGVDMTPAMLQRAHENKQRLGAHNVEFRRGQIEALPVVANSIDVVMSNCVINLSPDKPAVFAEVFRVLKPGGRVAVSDIVTEGEFDQAQRANLDEWSACVTGAIDVRDYTGLMREAGFTDIAVVDRASADELVERKPGMPRVFSARVTARKPA
jgi:SAM-dependent methyltransferase